MTLVEQQGMKSISDNKIIILSGDDRLSVVKKIADIQRDVGDNAFSELNTTHLDASLLDFNEISMQLNMFPLGGGKRIVILENASAAIAKKRSQEWLNNLITGFSPTTLLVIILEDKKKSKDWEKFPSHHWLRKLAKKSIGDIKWIELELPSERKMPEWILREAENKGGKFTTKAAVELSRLVGNDLFQARQEIEKCVLYVGAEKEVGVDVVQLLCAASKEEKIFDLVDAVGMQNGKLAFGLLNKLTTDMPIQYIFSMLIRQIRLLILAKEAVLSGGREKAVMAVCGTRFTFVAAKLIKQTRKFRIETLENIYRELDRIDEQAKQGYLSLDAAVDRLIANITN